MSPSSLEYTKLYFLSIFFVSILKYVRGTKEKQYRKSPLYIVSDFFFSHFFSVNLIKRFIYIYYTIHFLNQFQSRNKYPLSLQKLLFPNISLLEINSICHLWILILHNLYIAFLSIDLSPLLNELFSMLEFSLVFSFVLSVSLHSFPFLLISWILTSFKNFTTKFGDIIFSWLHIKHT